MINGNRNKSDKARMARDFYPTPLGLCRASLGLLKNELGLIPDTILDPGAGSGVWGQACRNIWGKQPYVAAVEINANDKIYAHSVFDVSNRNYSDWITHDYLSLINPSEFKYDLICGNPPYSHAQEFIEKSFEFISDGGYIFFLLRLEFLASQKRRNSLFIPTPPSIVWVSSRRPSFYGSDGKRTTDTLEYAMFLWRKDYKHDTILDWFTWDYDEQ